MARRQRRELRQARLPDPLGSAYDAGECATPPGPVQTVLPGERPRPSRSIGFGMRFGGDDAVRALWVVGVLPPRQRLEREAAR
jgi:hypothetical protein